MKVSLKVFCCVAVIQSLLLRSSVVAFYQFTVPHRILWNHAYKTLFEQEWRSCIKACQDDEKCISTNYLLQTAIGEKTTGGLCELNDEGVPDDKEREFGLIHSKGWMYHQIRYFESAAQSSTSSMGTQRKGHCACSPCLNNGTCVNEEVSYNCTCATGFTGRNCETNIDDCTCNPCLNNGTCSDGVESYNCTCPPGFTGDFCQFSNNCNSTWKLAYQHDENGTALQGDVQTLRSAVLAGARVRVLTTKDGDSQVSDADGLYEKDGHVYAEFKEYVSKKRWKTFATDEYWWRQVLSTSGHAHAIRLNLGLDKVREVNHTHIAAKWFVKLLNRHLFSNDKHGNFKNGNITALQAAIKAGHDIRCIVDGRFVLPLHNVKVVNRTVIGHHIHSINKSAHNIPGGLHSNTSAYWLFTSVKTTGSLYACAVGSQPECSHDGDHMNFDWFGDTCWEHVYTSKASSGSSEGSLGKLVSSIQNGARVRFQIPSQKYYTVEADNLSIRDGHVTAQTLKRIKWREVDKIVLVWLVVCTTGAVRVIKHCIGATNNKEDSTETLTIRWFIDTRPREPVMNPSNLVNAVGRGASVRWVEHDGKNAFSAQTLAIHENYINAQTLNYMSMESGGSCENKTKPDPYLGFIIVNSTGRLVTSRRKIGRIKFLEQDYDTVGLNWFVCH